MYNCSLRDRLSGLAGMHLNISIYMRNWAWGKPMVSKSALQTIDMGPSTKRNKKNDYQQRRAYRKSSNRVRCKVDNQPTRVHSTSGISLLTTCALRIIARCIHSYNLQSADPFFSHAWMHSIDRLMTGKSKFSTLGIPNLHHISATYIFYVFSGLSPAQLLGSPTFQQICCSIQGPGLS